MRQHRKRSQYRTINTESAILQVIEADSRGQEFLTIVLFWAKECSDQAFIFGQWRYIHELRFPE